VPPSYLDVIEPHERLSRRALKEGGARQIDAVAGVASALGGGRDRDLDYPCPPQGLGHGAPQIRRCGEGWKRMAPHQWAFPALHGQMAAPIRSPAAA